MSGNLCMVYLYSFHVYSFYFLPFLYNFKNENFSCFLKRKIKLFYLPYTIVFCVLLFLNWNFNNQDWGNIGIAYFTGSQENLRGVLSSGGFLWFIPTMFSLLLIRQGYYRLNIQWRILLLLLSLLCFLCYVFGWFPSLYIDMPFSCFIAMGMLFPSIFVRYAINKYSQETLSFIFFILVIILFLIFPLRDDYYDLYRVIKFGLCPIFIFLFIVSIRRLLSSIHIFQILGDKSYPIYIIHIFLYNILYLILDQYIEINIYLSLLFTILVLGVSYYISKMKIVSTFFS